MRFFCYKIVVVFVYCYGSKNFFNDKRYNGVFIKVNVGRIVDRL